MIYVVMGTKAQFIKMAPVIKRLEEENVEYILVDLGQHLKISSRLRKELDIRTPDVILGERDINQITRGMKWMIEVFIKGLSKKWISRNIFNAGSGVCLIHGDTASTLVALYLAKRLGLKVAHVEAGLRSWHLWEPFPEEIIRVFVMHLSDILFAPSRWAYDNLVTMGLGEKAILLPANTSLESTLWSLKKKVEWGGIPDNYALITAHRMENIFSKKRLQFIVNVIKKVTDILPAVFIHHNPTLVQLRKHRFLSQIEALPNIYIQGLTSHAHFIHLIARSEFVVTDGGSIQEECYYLNKPCLLLRNCTERIEGLGENVILSKFSERNLDMFLRKYKEFRHKRPLEVKSPAKEIIKVIKKFV